MPHEAVLGIDDPKTSLVNPRYIRRQGKNSPVILIRKVQEPTRHAALLQHVEERQPLRDGEPVVLVAVDDEHGGSELADALWGGWVEAAVVLAGVPEGSVEL